MLWAWARIAIWCIPEIMPCASHRAAVMLQLSARCGAAPPPATEDLDEPCFPCPRRNTLRASTDTFVGASSPNPQPGFEIVLTEGGMGFGEIDAGAEMDG